MHRRIALIAPLLAALGCSRFTEPRERVPARLLLVAETARVVVPAVVERGSAFDVTVTTFAGGCRRESAGTEVSVQGSTATVHPFHYLQRADICTDDLLLIPHTVQLRFDQPGTATVRFVGEGNRVETGEPSRPVTIERTLTVR